MEPNKMKTGLLTLTVIAALTIVGCGDQKNKDEQIKKAGVRIQAHNRMSSDELTNSAEQLVGPYTFMLAYKVAKTAYEKDPSNLKAEFYMKLLKRFEAFRGYATRIRPSLNAEQLKQHDQWINEFPESPLKNFLSDKGRPIKTVSDMQDVVSEYFEAVREFRQFLKKNQTAQLNLYINPYVFEEEIRKEMANSCQVFEKEEGLEITCDVKEIATKKLNTADLITLRQMVSAELLYSVVNSYSLEGIQKLEEKEQEREMSNKEKTEFLAGIKGFGLLRKSHVFGILKEIGADFSASIKWAVQYQKNLCPHGAETTNQRRGYLFSSGICVDGQDDELQEFLSVMDRALGGVTQVEMRKADGEMTTVTVNAFAWTSRPVRDLRQVMPIQWNACDKATSVKDNTLGGVFVEGNFNILMDTQCDGSTVSSVKTTAVNGAQ